MIALRGGIAYLIIGGLVWLDDTTQITLQEWFDAPDPLALVWRQGYRATGWAA